MLTAAQAGELSAARPRPGGRGLVRWLWPAGFLLAASWFSWFGLPLLSHLLAWAVPGLATGPATTRFWLSAGCTAILLWRYGIPALLALRRSTAAIQARHVRKPQASCSPGTNASCGAPRRSPGRVRVRGR
jgi:hypothetical protein